VDRYGDIVLFDPNGHGHPRLGTAHRVDYTLFEGGGNGAGEKVFLGAVIVEEQAGLACRDGEILSRGESGKI